MYKQINNFKIIPTCFKLYMVSLFSLLFFFSSASANDTTKIFTPLSGILPSVLTAEKSPYIVEADIFVTPGTTVSIESGVVLLFENFTGLHVQGSLYAKGTAEQPIIFTSNNDQYYNPYAKITAAPYDWNGIDVYENAIGSFFDNCTVQFSVYGIRSQTEHFKIHNSRFVQNGKSNVSIKDKLLDVTGDAFSYSENGSDDNTIASQDTLLSKSSVQNKIAPPLKTTIPIKNSNHKAFKNFMRYGGLVCFAGGVAASAWRYQKFIDSRNEIKDLSQDNDYNKLNHTSSDWKKANDNYKNESTLLGICSGIGLLGILAFSISFTF